MNYTRLILSAIILSMAAGCSVDERLVEPLSAQKDKELTIQAIREDGITDTKTSRDESDGSVWWTPGDALSLFYGSGSAGGSKFITTATESCRSADFSGTIGVITGGGEGTTIDDTFFWGLYPYQEDASCDGSSITMNLPSVQTAVPGTFATDLFPTLARSQGLIFKFYNICGGMMFSVTKEGLKKVTLKSNNGELITGKAKVGFNASSGLPEVKEIIDGSDEIVLEAPNGESFEVGKFYYMVMFPTTFSGGFTVKLETFTEEATVEKTNKITAKRSVFGKIAGIDGNAAYTKKTGAIPVEDPNFKEFLVCRYDTDSDGEISYDEAANIKWITLSRDEMKKDIMSLKGIEYMTELNILWCFDHEVTVIDFSNNRALSTLACRGMNLTDVYLPRDGADCKAIEFSNCMLSSLDVSGMDSLEYLYCNDNQLHKLNVSGCSSLKYLRCDGNRISNLEIASCISLESLDCSNNQLLSIDLSNNTLLTSLGCNSNQLTSLDLSNNTSLTSLDCSSNQLASLDLSDFVTLEYLWCDNSQLSHLDLSNCTALTNISCRNSQLSSIILLGCKALETLNIPNNLMSSLDLSDCTSIKGLYCNDNQMTAIDVSNCPAIEVIECSHNQLERVDVSNSFVLKTLSCSSNKITSIDISSNTELTRLRCSNNYLREIDVSNNTSLTILDCSPMTDSDGNNLLSVIYISEGQEIPNITKNRDSKYIPDGTTILNAPITGGGGEGTGEEDW